MRAALSLANFKNKFIFSLGGQNYFNTSADAYRYEIKSDTWINIPAMNKSRCSHSSCFMGNHLYVSGGCNLEGHVASIERLAIADDESGTPLGGWETLQVSYEFFGRLLMAPLDANEILLFHTR